MSLARKELTAGTKTWWLWPGHNFNDVIMSAMASQITSLTIVYSTVYSGLDQRKHQSSATLAFVRGNHRWPVNSPHKGPVTRKMFPFDGVIIPGPVIEDIDAICVCFPLLEQVVEKKTNWRWFWDAVWQYFTTEHLIPRNIYFEQMFMIWINKWTNQSVDELISFIICYGKFVKSEKECRAIILGCFVSIKNEIAI